MALLRFNDKDVAFLAKNARVRTDRAGLLLKKGETNTAFKQRYFVLKANLLFYFKAAAVRGLPTDVQTFGSRYCQWDLATTTARSPTLTERACACVRVFGAHTCQDPTPIGFVLLEDCRISVGDNDSQIVLAFSTPGARAYVLEAKDRYARGPAPCPHVRHAVCSHRARTARTVSASGTPATRRTSGSWPCRTRAGCGCANGPRTCRKRWSAFASRCRSRPRAQLP